MTPIDPGVVSLAADLRAQERQAAEEVGQWKTRAEERKVIDASAAAIKPVARHGEPAQVIAANAVAADGRSRLDGVIGWSRIRAVAAPQMGDRASADSLRWNLDLILDQRGADMADLPSGASGLLVRDYQGEEADIPVTRIDPGWSHWFASPPS